jgi:hypothetical protein
LDGLTDRPIDRLPERLTHLTLGVKFFDQPVDRLPDNLVQLSGPEYLLRRPLGLSLDSRKIRVLRDYSLRYCVVFQFLGKGDAKSDDLKRKRSSEGDGETSSKRK